MKHKVSFFLWVVGFILMLAGLGTMLLKDKTPVSGVLWLVGVILVLVSTIPLTVEGKKR